MTGDTKRDAYTGTRTEGERGGRREEGRGGETVKQ